MAGECCNLEAGPDTGPLDVHLENLRQAAKQESRRSPATNQMRGRGVLSGTKLREVTTNAKGRPQGAQFDRAYLGIERCDRQRVDKLIPQHPVNCVSRLRSVERDVQRRIAAFEEQTATRHGERCRRAAAQPSNVLGTALQESVGQ